MIQETQNMYAEQKPFSWVKVIILNIVVVTVLVASIITFFVYTNNASLFRINLNEYVNFVGTTQGEESGLLIMYDIKKIENVAHVDSESLKNYIYGLEYEIDGIFFTAEKSEGDEGYAFVVMDIASGVKILSVSKDEEYNEKYGFELITYNIPVLIFSQETINMTNLSLETLKDHYARVLTYMEYSEKAPELLEKGVLTVIYYKEEVYMSDIWDESAKNPDDTEGLTILYGLKYKNEVYFIGETNIVNINGQGEQGYYLSGDFYDEEKLQLNAAQRDIDAIDEAMKLKGYTKYEI